MTIGVVYSVAYLSGAVLTALWGYLSDRYGRRNILMLLALLTIVSNAIFVFFSSLFFILLAVIIANVGAGGSGGGGSGGGPFNPVEEALLAEKCLPENRNADFRRSTLSVGSVMGSVGALAAGLPQCLQERWGWDSRGLVQAAVSSDHCFQRRPCCSFTARSTNGTSHGTRKRKCPRPPACSSPRCRS